MERLNIFSLEIIYKKIIDALTCNCCTRRGRSEFKEYIQRLPLPHLQKRELLNKFYKNHVQIRLYLSQKYSLLIFFPILYHRLHLLNTCTVSFHRMYDNEYIITNRIIPHFQYLNNMSAEFYFKTVIDVATKQYFYGLLHSYYREPYCLEIYVKNMKSVHENIGLDIVNNKLEKYMKKLFAKYYRL